MMQPSEAWRLLPFSRQPADQQMAWAEAMLALPRSPALRWRQIVPWALILGHGERLAHIDLDACRRAGGHVHRRSTGGTAVLSGPEMLTVDVVLPAGHPLAIADVTRSYRWLGEAVALGLRAIGIAAEAVSPETARAQVQALTVDDPLRLACYAALSPYEVIADGRKLVGLAQARRRAGVLLQAGILLRWQPEHLVPLLALPEASREVTIAAMRDRAVGVEELLRQGDGDAEPTLPALLTRLMQGLTEAIASMAGATVQPAGWTNAERAAMAEALPRFAPLD